MPRSIFLLFLFTGYSHLPLQAQTPDSIDRGLVVNWFQDQQYEQAANYLQGRVNTGNANHLALLGYAYYQWGKWPQTISTYQQILQLDSQHISAHQYLASIYMQQDQAAQAIHHYRKLISLRPQQALYYKQLSFACYANHQPDTGFVYLQKAYALNPSDSKVVARLAEEWMGLQRYAAADSVLLPYLAADSVQSVVIIPAVKNAFYQKDYARAITLGKRLMRMQVISATAYTYVAAACYYMKQYQECIYVNDFLTLQQLNTEATMYYAAMSYSALKEYARSNELLQHCIDLSKSRSLDDYYTAMGDNYESLGAYRKATACLDTAYYLFQSPLRQYSIARIYDQRLQNPAAARRYYRRYLLLARPRDEDPAISKYVQQRLGEMEKRK
jgi:tetratricopeptide (TPR) repeat protein